jgi:hypothetical protein
VLNLVEKTRNFSMPQLLNRTEGKKIPTLTSSDGIAYNDHGSKSAIIWSTFSKRLGSSHKPTMHISLGNLINRTDGLDSLSLPFSTEEIDNIIKMLLSTSNASIIQISR